MAETFTLYKLIILYMLNKVDFPLTTSQISEFVLDEGYTTYFKPVSYTHLDVYKSQPPRQSPRPVCARPRNISRRSAS